jgi:hypothetical protein
MKWIVLCCAVAGSATAAEVMRWTDADGVVHYGRHAPAGVVPRAVEVRPDLMSGAGGLRPGESQMLETIAHTPARAVAVPRAARRAVTPTADLCQQARAERQRMIDRMRAGYTAAQYNGLRARELRARRDILSYCE